MLWLRTPPKKTAPASTPAKHHGPVTGSQRESLAVNQDKKPSVWEETSTFPGELLVTDLEIPMPKTCRGSFRRLVGSSVCEEVSADRRLCQAANLPESSAECRQGPIASLQRGDQHATGDLVLRIPKAPRKSSKQDLKPSQNVSKRLNSIRIPLEFHEFSMNFQ